jgi:hypothetical protein
MNRFWDRWATQHRNWEAIVTAVVFLSIVAWGLVQLRSAKLVKTTYETGVVTEVKKPGAATAGMREGESGGVNIHVGSLELNDSTTIQILLVPPIPRPGDRVPLKVEHYNDGSRTYTIDRERWQMHGSE